MLNSGVFEFRAARDAFAELQPFQPRLVDDLPDVPAMPETLLSMELSIHEFSVDLRAFSQLVLGDLGASLQILRLAAWECGSDACPSRMEDSISALGLQACLKAAARATVLSDARHRGVFEFWAHSREIAERCRDLAVELNGDFHPEEAYFVGLFHGLGLLPQVLGWEWRGSEKRDWASVGRRLADRWSLPPCVREFFAETRWPASGAPWNELVRKAHGMAKRSPIGCPLFELPRHHSHAM